MYGPLPKPLLIWPLLILVAAVVLPGIMNNYVLYVGSLLMMYAVLALGLDLIMGRAGQFAFSHIAFYALGAYTPALLQNRYGIPFPVGFVAGIVLSSVIALGLARASVRMRHIYLGLATVAFASGIHWVFANWRSFTGGTEGLRILPADFVLFQVVGDQAAFRVLCVMFALVLLATFYLVRSKFGRSMAAIRDSEHVAAVSGISVPRTKAWVFVVSSAYASVAGSMLIVFNTFISPDNFTFAPAVLLLTMLVVGGMGTLPGVLIGSVILGLLPEFLRTTMKDYLIWQEFVYGLILVLSITLMPQGIWGLIKQTFLSKRTAK